MLPRRSFLHGAAFSPLALLAASSDAPKTVSVVVDFSPEGAGSDSPAVPLLAPSPAPVSALLIPWERWAGFGADASGLRVLSANPPGLVGARAVRVAQTRRVGVALASTAEDAATVRLDTRLGSGLWRIEAAVVQAAQTGDTPSEPSAKTWRMESVLRPVPGAVVKTLPLRTGQTLYLRWTETVRDAELSLERVQKQTAGLSVTTYSGESVPNALGRVGEIIAVLPVLIEKNNRPEIIKRVHRALLTVAQAEAMAQNAQQASLEERDAAFDALTLALSEISCAAWNLIPRQSVETGKDGMSLRVSVTNGGTRVLPILSLAAEGVTGGEAKNARPVFRSVAPGATVSARFALQDGDAATARGVVQFIVEMGAARVFAQPLAAPDTAPADPAAVARDERALKNTPPMPFRGISKISQQSVSRAKLWMLNPSVLPNPP